MGEYPVLECLCTVCSKAEFVAKNSDGTYTVRCTEFGELKCIVKKCELFHLEPMTENIVIISRELLRDVTDELEDIISRLRDVVAKLRGHEVEEEEEE